MSENAPQYMPTSIHSPAGKAAKRTIPRGEYLTRTLDMAAVYAAVFPHQCAGNIAEKAKGRWTPCWP